jgi:prepilin-type N-terminal cleavage/methylation domain-containing protein
MRSSKTSKATGERGLTLIELLVVLSLIALGAVLSVPSGRSLGQVSEAEGTAREMLNCLRMARWKAVVSGECSRLAFHDRGGGDALWYVIEGWDGRDWQAEGESRRIPPSVKMSTTGPATKVFYPDGTCSLGSILLSGQGAAGYRISLNPATGRARLWRGGKEVGHEG